MAKHTTIAAIGVLMGNAGRIEGAQEGVRLMKQHIKYGENVVDAGDISPNEKTGICRGLKNLKQVACVNRQLRKRSMDESAQGRVPFTLGGDHTCALGSIAATCESYGRDHFGVIYLDAHGDLNTPETSDTGNLHGMPLAASMGFGDEELIGVAHEKAIPQHVLMLAQRNLDEGERELIAREGISLIDCDEINREGAEKILMKIRDFITEHDIRNLHFSIDIDALDGEIAPGTGVPEPNGLSLNDMFAIVKGVAEMDEMASIELVEFNPSLDIDGKTENICYQLIDTIIATVCKKS